MLIFAPILLGAIIFLCASSLEKINDNTLKKTFKKTLYLIFASIALFFVLGAFSFAYTQHYQEVNNACPPGDTYVAAILIFGGLGLIVFLYDIIKLFKQKATSSGFMMLAASFLYIQLAWLAMAASFCLDS
jgi:hypothetical protein